MAGTSRWIELDGAANVRDLGGLSSRLGGATRSRRLIRADNLQDLSERDRRVLVDDHGVRTVVDLRTAVEVRSEGPGPLTSDDRVTIEHLSLFPGDTLDVEVSAVVEAGAGPVVLPWQGDAPGNDERREASYGYPMFLVDRPDSVLRALRLIGDPDGATLVHCAAGKDRTGVVIAVALTAVGVDREDVVDDYALSAERVERVMARLGQSKTYADDIAGNDIDRQRPRPETMRRFLEKVDEEMGGIDAWLAGQGWTPADQRALEASLLDR